MVNCVQIFVEGETDVKFISDYISHIKPEVQVSITEKGRKSDITLNECLIATIHGLRGWSDIKNMKPTIAQYKGESNDVLVIFDADTNDNEGGFVKRKKQIEDYALLLDGIFLFPDNKSDGTLEDLLENIINQSNSPIFNCWENYESCLQECASKKMEKKLTTPAKKSKIYSYLEVLAGKTQKEKDKIKPLNRDYTNSEYWNLDADFLIPLKEFLLKHLT
jgi:hypothetical protein